MKLLLVAVFTTFSWAAPPSGYDNLELAKPCLQDKCELPDCRCASVQTPAGLTASQTPQLVLLTFDDAVTVANIDYYREAFRGRTNPDGCPISTTYFVSHEYTDYNYVHELWSEGHEIALHSISHQTPQDYWKDLDTEGYVKEFTDERKLIAKFAQIPEEDIQGIRNPFLQPAGNNSFEMLKQSGLKYDCSLPTRNYLQPGLWPYTLDYKTLQDCQILPCPTASLPGVWVVPMIDWLDTQGYPCSMVDSCAFMPTEADKILEVMKKNFQRHYNTSEINSNRAPFGFYVHAAWFGRSSENWKAYNKFLDYLESFEDVYIVSVQRALQWVQNPSPLNSLESSWPSCQATHPNTCEEAQTCVLPRGQETMYMKICDRSCPAKYPWLGNPLGEDK